MDFDMPSPSQFSSSSQWVRACTRRASADMSADMDVGVVRWMASQSADPAMRKLLAEDVREKEREHRLRSSASGYTSTSSWTPSTSSTTRTASLPTFSATSSNTLPCRPSGSSTSGGKPPPRSKPMSKKVPPSRAYSATARMKDNVPLDLSQAAALLDMIGNMKKKEISDTSGASTARRSTVSTSSVGLRSTSSASAARHPAKTASTSTTPGVSASAPSIKTLSSTTIKPTIKLSRDSGTDTDVEMTIDSDRDSVLEGSIFADTMNESFSMHVDNIVLPPAKRPLGRMHRAGTVSSTSCSTAASSNSGFASSSKVVANASSTFMASLEKQPQSTQVRPPVAPSTSQRHPPPLGMRRPPNLPSTGNFSSQSRYVTTQSPYAASQTKGQKQATLPPFKPPLLSKPKPKPVHIPKQIAQNPGSPNTLTPELEEDNGDDDHEGGVACADSSFDVSFDVDADALEATMRQYD
ncbi:hypothetical protein K503DRAFT_775583 [Rhizopogon vinicolor AM-OR11-026]|uniref:Uncharacterized protein n=1 Tax=Rhizopogon vinicolor AM-OR11-026 TaxID=1314800 RepID=A0A1B7MLI5_9AGAM|nr:hypothetical protein K503DRAFT_775583 [Rhizopogon vinicolor AM-OR11-026]